MERGHTAEERAHPQAQGSNPQPTIPIQMELEVQGQASGVSQALDVSQKLGRHTEQGCRARTEQLVGMEVTLLSPLLTADWDSPGLGQVCSCLEPLQHGLQHPSL